MCAKQVQWRRGSTAAHATFVGANGEITVDTTKKTLVVHDGITPGGSVQATEKYVNDAVATIDMSSYPSKDYVDTLNGQNVKLTGNQTIADVKTFSSNIVGNITGNAGTATKLATARTINGVAFDGTANIVAPTNLGITAGTTAGPIVTSSTGTNATLPTASASASGVVTTGDQTWAGVKTFTSSPIVPTATTVTQAVNKGQLDLKAPLESPTFTGIPKIGTDNITSISTAVTDNTIARYDGTTGKLQNSGVVIDDSGNVGIGVTPSAWGSSIKAIEQGNRTALFEFNGDTVLSNNAYHTGANWIRKTANACSMYETINGTHYWSVAPTGTAGSPIDLTNVMVLDANCNLLLLSGTGALGYGTGAGGTVTQLTSKSTSVTLNKPCGQITMHNEAFGAGASVFFAVNNNLVTTMDNIVLTMAGPTTNTNYSVFPTFSVLNGQFYIMVKNISAVSLSEALVINFLVIKGSNT